MQCSCWQLLCHPWHGVNQLFNLTWDPLNLLVTSYGQLNNLPAVQLNTIDFGGLTLFGRNVFFLTSSPFNDPKDSSGALDLSKCTWQEGLIWLYWLWKVMRMKFQWMFEALIDVTSVLGPALVFQSFPAPPSRLTGSSYDPTKDLVSPSTLPGRQILRFR